MVHHKLCENPEFASENSVKAYKWSANMSSFYTTYKYIYNEWKGGKGVIKYQKIKV